MFSPSDFYLCTFSKPPKIGYGGIIELTNFAKTLMSTDIVQWSSDNDTIPPKKTFALGALELFLELCLPLMAITLALSYIYYRHVRGVTNAKYNKLARRFAAQRMPTAGTYNEE